MAQNHHSALCPTRSKAKSAAEVTKGSIDLRGERHSCRLTWCSVVSQVMEGRHHFADDGRKPADGGYTSSQKRKLSI
jgi:hypothetical protein